eukprot:TRINITY_DN26891_c0_g1_i1.p1 TRINITY_DN26891_c0_g1~~TRINITY_DN26891_c0_g1_i1.p1  ORF type:complete len:790 (+),score=247.71 TRINITY_DN26891_c0_g1_i1:82-2451(+)
MSVINGSNTMGSIGSAREVSRKELWSLCVECINTFNPMTHTVDSHVGSFLEKKSTPLLDEDSEDFLQQVFYGTTRYRKMLEMAINKYQNVMRRMNDCFTPLLMIGYLAMFRVEELGMMGFRQLITGACSPSRISEFLSFLFTPSSTENFSTAWRAIYDDTYVDNTLLDHIETYSDKMLELAETFNKMASGLETMKQQQMGGTRVGSGKQPTVSQPFNLSKHNGKKVAPPQETFTKPKYRRPIEDCSEEKLAAIAAYKQGVQASSLDKEAKQKNREREEAKPVNAPSLAVLQRPSNMAEMKARRQAELEAEFTKQKTPCASPEAVKKRMERQPVENPKLTTAALLREEHVYTKKQEEEEELLRRKAVEMRDDTEFRVWQQKMQDADDEDARNAVALRKVEMMLSDEEARIARKKEEQRKAKLASKIKEDISDKLTEVKELQQRQLEENKTLVAMQAEISEQNVKKAKADLKEENATRARLIKEEDKLLELKVAERLELELQRKADVIRQIREEGARLRMVLGADGSVTKKMFRRDYDPSSTMGIGTLNEMSLIELQDKLMVVRQQHNEAVKLKREQIEKDRDDAKEKNERRLENVLKKRAEKRANCTAQRIMKQDERATLATEQAARDRIRLQALQAKLQEKREQRRGDEESRKDQDRKRRLEQQLKSADEGAIERKKWVEMERGLQNISKLRQLKGIEAAKIERLSEEKMKRQQETWVEANIQKTEQHHARQRAELDESKAVRKAQQTAEKLSLKHAASVELADKKARKQLHATNKAFDAIDTLLTHDE